MIDKSLNFPTVDSNPRWYRPKKLPLDIYRQNEKLVNNVVSPSRDAIKDFVNGINYLFNIEPEDKKMVLEFLSEHPSVVRNLIDTNGKIRKYFPEGELALEVISSNNGDEPKLKITIQPVGDSSIALAKFSQFKEYWWSHEDETVQETILVNIEHADFKTSGDPWDIMDSLIGTVEGPSDWSLEHDHYLYNTPKHHQ